jgi:hypothetical protein
LSNADNGTVKSRSNRSWGALTAIAKIVYDPDKLILVFANPTEDDDYWSVEGDTFLPDLTEYYASSSFTSASYVYIENNIPTTAENKVGTISFNTAGSMVTSNASDVFNATVNNRNEMPWAVVGKDRKLIGQSYTDMGNLSVDPDKPLITLGNKKFAQSIGLCGFICSYYEVDCCPYINGNWVAVDANNNALADSNAAYFTIQAGAGWLRLKKSAEDAGAGSYFLASSGSGSASASTGSA